jgi:phospholipid/cholesterol/gamma-HCH transport system permease protein
MSECIVQCPEILDQDGGASMYKQLLEQWSRRDKALILDFSATDSIDSFGGAWVIKAAGFACKKEMAFSWRGQRDSLCEFLEMLAPSLQAEPPVRTRTEGPLESFGGLVLSAKSELGEFISLCVDTIYWTIIAPFEGRGFRFNAFLDEVHEMGVRAVRIVCLMNFLLGLIIAMLSAKQVESFGIQIYVANLIFIGFARELAAVMTAVVVSARSGAAIAAELATMTVQEEIDALRGMGISPAQYLVTPKLLAMLVVLPCLATLGLISGVLGGAVWGIFVLGFRPFMWFNQTLESAAMDDIMQGMLKTFFFAVAIVMIGCHNGFRVRGGSRGVGLMTTRAVVMDIFSLICIDIVFASIFYYLLG